MAVSDRYSAASQAAETALCCPVQYQSQYLEVLPQELIERDYGCGDPSRDVQAGETVLDLGSGGGKVCYIASQIVGQAGQVIGIDMNDDMLALAREHQPIISERIGWNNVRFYKARIQDLALDLNRLEDRLQEGPVQSTADWLDVQRWAARQRQEDPMIGNDTIDVVISNCVLNLVETSDRQQMFAEIFRVLKRGGRAVISDIVCDEPVPDHLKADAELWSGCISGAFVEHEFLQAFAEAGFYGMEIVARQSEPWAVVEGIEFRSLTVRAYKGKEGPCLDHRQAVVYQGPWKTVEDDDGHVLRRGERMAVCQKNFQIYTRPPYQDQIVAVEPATPVTENKATPFNCREGSVRSPAETKASTSSLTILPGDECCGPDECC
ncbi:MAG TPA: methyltransferase domain-containing protein [Planctomycetes bacterium]|nr:methyltransferase domain-containing protein [Planctomycetota bacterium]